MYEGSLIYNYNSKRYAINGEYELHCGEVIEIYVEGTWKKTSVEFMNKKFYLTTGENIETAIGRMI